jgi:hypothetical protein
MASEVAADDGSFKQVSRKLKQKRCGDCREWRYGSQGNWSQNLSAALKTGIEISVRREWKEWSLSLWKVEVAAPAGTYMGKSEDRARLRLLLK